MLQRGNDTMTLATQLYCYKTVKKVAWQDTPTKNKTQKNQQSSTTVVTIHRCAFIDERELNKPYKTKRSKETTQSTEDFC